MEDLVGKNIDRDPIKIEHSSLERPKDTLYRSDCPECKDGMLLVRRDPKNLKLQEIDNCILCGQTYVYTDIEKLRDKDYA